MIQPPRKAIAFLKWFCREDCIEEIEGDLIEIFEKEIRISKNRANRKFFWRVIRYLRPEFIKPFKRYYPFNRYSMLRNYFKISFRVLLKNKGYSIINICGLAAGLAAAILILLWVRYEFSYDAFYPKASRIYQLFCRDINKGQVDVWGNTPALMAPELKQSYGEIESVARYQRVVFLLKVNENHFNDAGAFADPEFLSMFGLPMIEGSRKALEDNYGIVLTKSMAIRLFGKTDCVGKTVIVNDNDNFKVTGVLEDRPDNTDFKYAYLLPWEYITRLGWDRNQTWEYTNATTFVLLNKGTSSNKFQSGIVDIIKAHTREVNREVLVHPLKKVHLFTKAENGQLTGGRIETVRLFIIIAVIIILIACINFMNLSTARSEKRSHEVGVRKIIGAYKGSLITQFIIESIVYVLLAFFFAIILVQLSIEWFRQLTGTSLDIPFNSFPIWTYAGAMIIITSLLAGSYPAFYLSSFNPLKVLKGSFKNPNNLFAPRKILVVAQFTLAIMLSICAIFVHRQIQFAQNRDAGYNRGGIAYNFMQGDVALHFESIKNELLKSGAVISVTRTFSPITRIWNMASGFSWQGSDETDAQSTFLVFGCDAGLTSTFGIRIKEGRDIDIYAHPSDTAAVLLNESAVSAMRLKDATGAIIRDSNGKSWNVAGVVANFIVESPYDPVNPMIIEGWTDRYGVFNFKLNHLNNLNSDLTKVEDVFKKYNPEYPFEYYFDDDYYNRKFNDEKQTEKLGTLFAGLTIFISCLGLFGLAAYMTEVRTKEIAVRKVLGASVFSVAALLSKEFIRLVLIAIILATPLTWWVVKLWLQSFSYRVSINLWIFLIAGIASILIAVLTVVIQSIKAALLNPVENLRSE